MRVIERIRLLSALIALTAIGTSASAQSLDGIVNFRAYSPNFASAGQPTVDQFELIRDAGFERIVYIAFSDDRNAIANEDKLVRELGMQYVHIPVIWDAPTAAEFEGFAAVMQRDPDVQTLLHCQVNFRASAFAMLYRVIYEGVPLVEAYADMATVWQPNDIWRDLILAVLEAHDVDSDCDGCSWAD